MIEQIAKLMKNLNISEEEAIQVIADDKAIDRGEKMSFDLSKEQEKEAKKWKNVDTKTAKSPKKTPNRKKDEQKAQIIADLADFLSKKYKNCEIINAEREISVQIDQISYSLTLIKHRK